MTPDQIALVQNSFAKVVPISAVAAVIFYERLFETNPEFRGRFAEDMDAQRGKLMSTLAAVVRSLHDLDSVLPTIRALGARHVGYDTKPEDYAPVGAALLWTLKEGLGDAFTPDVEDAWAAAYALISSEMIGADPAATKAAE